MIFGFLLILPLMLIIIAGNLLYRHSFLSDSDVNCLTRLLYWVVLPAYLFKNCYLSGSEIFKNGNLFLAATSAYFITAVLSWLVSAKILHRGTERAAASIMSSIRANNLYVGFPVIQMALGEAGVMQASVCLATIVISYHTLSIAGAEIALSGKLSFNQLKKTVVKLMLNPLIISCIAGILFSVLNIPVPQPFMHTLSMLGNAATALALIALGASLKLDSLTHIANLFSKTWCDNVLRFVLAPVVMLLTLKIFPVSPFMAKVTLLLTCMPAAVNCFVLAKGMNMDEKYMASVVASTTIVSAIAIPVWVMLLKIG